MRTRVCKVCGEEKELNKNNFYLSKGYFLHSCKCCIRKKNRNKIKEDRKEPKLKEIYNERSKKWRENKINQNPNFWSDEYNKNPEAAKSKSKKYRQNNKEKISQSNKKKYNKNKNRYLSISKKWKDNNRERYKEKHREWLKNNKDIVKLYNQKRRALKRKAVIQSFTLEQLNQRMSVFGFNCAYCNGKFEHVDHVIPLSKGGKHCLANLRPACKFCNLSKGNKKLKDWLQ